MNHNITVSDYAQKLAMFHGVSVRKTACDYAAEVITRLSDDDVATDVTEDTLVELKRQKIIDGRQMVDLLSRHYEQRKPV